MRALLCCAAVTLAACAGAPVHEHRHATMAQGAAAQAPDTRVAVALPEPLRVHMLASMREHLATLAAIQQALGRGAYDDAAGLAERNLGMSSLDAHGARHVAPFMPQPMQRLGSAMHEEASRFAIAASDAGATGDARPALAALGRVSAQCVACHAAYRLQ